MVRLLSIPAALLVLVLSCTFVFGANPVAPTVELRFPSHVSNCSSETITLDASRTAGMGSDDKDFIFSLLEVSDVPPLASLLLPFVLTNQSCADNNIQCVQLSPYSPVLYLAADQFPGSGRLVFGVIVSTITSNVTAAANCTTEIISWAPTLGILKQNIIQRTAAVAFEPHISPASCASLPADVTSQFQWNVQQLSVTPAGVPSFAPFSCTTFSCTIPPSMLIPALNYSISVRGIFSTSTQSVIVSYDEIFTVDRSNLVASIVGGNRARPSDSAIVISAESSYDPDTGNASGLSYIWSCEDVTDTSSPPAACNILSSLQNSSVLQFPANSLDVDHILSIGVTVISALDGRLSSAEVLLSVIPPANRGPLVLLDLPSTFVSSQSVIRMNSVAVSMTSTPSYSLQYSWICTSDVTLQLSLVSLTPTNGSALTLASGALQPGRNYTFQVTVVDPLTGVSAISSGTIHTSGLPSSGVCILSPTSGMAFTTTFTIVCSGWVDELGGPLSYGLVYHPGNQVNSVLLTDANPLPIAKFVLPSGVFNLTVSIASEVNAISYVTLMVNVTADISSIDDPICYARQLRLNAVANPPQSIQQLIAVLGQIAQVLNIKRLTSNNASSTCDDTIEREQLLSTLHSLVSLDAAPSSLVIQTLSFILDEAVLNDSAGWNNASSIIQPVIDRVTSNDNDLARQIAVLLDLMIVDCTRIDSVNAMMHRLLTNAHMDTNPDEDMTELTQLNLQAALLRTDMTSGIALNLPNGVAVLLPSLYLMNQTDFSQSVNISTIDLLSHTVSSTTLDTRVVTLDPRWAVCRNPSNSTQLSDITDITVTLSNGTHFDISNLTGPIQFQIPIRNTTWCGHQITPLDGSSMDLSCKWWNMMTQSWSTDGCSLVPTNSSSIVTCECSHLTEFVVTTSQMICSSVIPVMWPQISLRLSTSLSLSSRSSLQSELATGCGVDKFRILITKLKPLADNTTQVKFTITPAIGIASNNADTSSAAVTSQGAASHFFDLLFTESLSVLPILKYAQFDSSQSEGEGSISSAAPDLVRVSLSLSYSLDSLPGGYSSFRTKLILDVAKAAQVITDRVFLVSLEAGSVHAVLTIAPQLDDSETPPAQAAAAFMQQATNPNSQLYQGEVTNQMTSAQVDSFVPLTGASDSDSNGTSVNTAVIVGSVCGSVGGLALILVSVLLWKRHRISNKVSPLATPTKHPSALYNIDSDAASNAATAAAPMQSQQPTLAWPVEEPK